MLKSKVLHCQLIRPPLEILSASNWMKLSAALSENVSKLVRSSRVADQPLCEDNPDKDTDSCLESTKCVLTQSTASWFVHDCTASWFVHDCVYNHQQISHSTPHFPRHLESSPCLRPGNAKMFWILIRTIAVANWWWTPWCAHWALKKFASKNGTLGMWSGKTWLNSYLGWLGRSINLCLLFCECRAR